MAFVFASPSQANLWSTKTVSGMVGQQHWSAVGPLGRLYCYSPAQSVISWKKTKSCLVPGPVQLTAEYWQILVPHLLLVSHYSVFISNTVTSECPASSVTQAAPEVPHWHSEAWLSLILSSSHWTCPHPPPQNSEAAQIWLYHFFFFFINSLFAFTHSVYRATLTRY